LNVTFRLRSATPWELTTTSWLETQRQFSSKHIRITFYIRLISWSLIVNSIKLAKSITSTSHFFIELLVTRKWFSNSVTLIKNARKCYLLKKEFSLFCSNLNFLKSIDLIAENSSRQKHEPIVYLFQSRNRLQPWPRSMLENSERTWRSSTGATTATGWRMSTTIWKLPFLLQWSQINCCQSLALRFDNRWQSHSQMRVINKIDCKINSWL
jgi:hypothetical protein